MKRKAGFTRKDLLELIEESNRQMRVLELHYRAEELSNLRHRIVEIVKKTVTVEKTTSDD